MKTTFWKYAAVALAVFLLAGCAARRKAAEGPEKEKVEQAGINREEILSRIRAAGFHQDSTERRITLTVGGKSVSGTLRMVQGRRTWINISVLGITFARAMFTPDSLQYYERVAKTTFQGRWEELHRLSPVLSALNYPVVEDLLCGRAAFPLSARDFVPEQTPGEDFRFSRRDARSGVSFSATVDSRTYRLVSQQLVSPDGKVGLKAEYVYSGEEALPRSALFTLMGISERAVRIDYSPGGGKMQAEFPFKVPRGYHDAREWLRSLGVDI